MIEIPRRGTMCPFRQNSSHPKGAGGSGGWTFAPRRGCEDQHNKTPASIQKLTIKEPSVLSDITVQGSGGWIRTNDLRVMRDFPVFGTFFTQASHFSLA